MKLPTKSKDATLKQAKRTIRVLGLDPGTRNMGWGAVEMTAVGNKVTNVEVLGCGKLDFPMASLLSVSNQMPDFLGDVWSRYAPLGCTHIVVERFQNRGAASAGDGIEVIAFMIGALQMFVLDTLGVMTIIPASQWKNRIKRKGLDLKELYKDRTKFLGEPHELDGVLQACYGAQIQLGLIPEYNFLIKPLVQQIHERSTCLETVNRIARLNAVRLKQNQK